MLSKARNGILITNKQLYCERVYILAWYATIVNENKKLSLIVVGRHMVRASSTEAPKGGKVCFDVRTDPETLSPFRSSARSPIDSIARPCDAGSRARLCLCIAEAALAACFTVARYPACSAPAACPLS